MMDRATYLDEARTALARVFEVDDETEALEALAELAQDLADLIDDVAGDGCLGPSLVDAALNTALNRGHGVLSPVESWTDDDGPVLWWRSGEPPWVGSPLEDEWQEYGAEYFDGWTPLPTWPSQIPEVAA
jgi:hypothetical protein